MRFRFGFRIWLVLIIIVVSTIVEGGKSIIGILKGTGPTPSFSGGPDKYVDGCLEALNGFDLMLEQYLDDPNIITETYWRSAMKKNIQKIDSCNQEISTWDISYECQESYDHMAEEIKQMNNLFYLALQAYESGNEERAVDLINNSIDHRIAAGKYAGENPNCIE